MQFYTIGHSTLAISDFVAILKAHGIDLLVDIRSYPTSRYCPQFKKNEMSSYLLENGIGYIWLPFLGGKRGKWQSDKNNIYYNMQDGENKGWRVAAFRNYADYTKSINYKRGLDDLMDLAKIYKLAYCCCESVPWKCHRLLVSNSLTALGHEVFHIMTAEKLEKHELGRYGAKPQMVSGELIYPANP